MLQRALKTVPGVIDVTGYGGTVKQYQVLVDPRLLRQYGITLQQVEDAISKSNANVGGDILTLGSQSHNVRAVGLLGKGIDPLDPANVDQPRRHRGRKLDDIANVVVTQYQRQRRSTSATSPRWSMGNRPRLGIVGRTRGQQENDVVEGIVLMRKYEKSLPTFPRPVKDKIKEHRASGTSCRRG